MNIIDEICSQKIAIKNSIIHMSSNGYSYGQILKKLIEAYPNPYFTKRVI
jgi:hypothetical protein